MKTTTLITFAVILGIVFSSCKKKGCTDKTAQNYAAEAEKDDGSCSYATEAAVTLKFTHNIDGMNLTSADFDQLNHVNAEGNTYSVTKMQVSISNVRFYRANGDSVFVEGYHFIDMEDTATLRYVLPEAIPTDPFIGIGFNYGFDDADNISGQYADLNALSWSSPEMLGGGYHQMKFEGRYIDSAADTIGFQYHNLSKIRQINGTDTTFHANYAHIDLSQSFNFTGNTSIEIKMDINEWFQNPNLWDLNLLYTVLMPNYGAQLMMKQNANTVFSIGEVIE